MIRHPLGDVFPFWAVVLATVGALLIVGYLVGYVRTVASMRPAIGWRWALALALFWPIVWLIPDAPPSSYTGSETPPQGGAR